MATKKLLGRSRNETHHRTHAFPVSRTTLSTRNQQQNQHFVRENNAKDAQPSQLKWGWDLPPPLRKSGKRVGTPTSLSEPPPNEAPRYPRGAPSKMRLLFSNLRRFSNRNRFFEAGLRRFSRFRKRAAHFERFSSKNRLRADFRIETALFFSAPARRK